MERDRNADEGQPLDPIALTLAVWLGVIAGATGLVHMAQDAAARTALAQAVNAPTASELAQRPQEPSPLFNTRLMAFGG